MLTTRYSNVVEKIKYSYFGNSDKEDGIISMVIDYREMKPKCYFLKKETKRYSNILFYALIRNVFFFVHCLEHMKRQRPLSLVQNLHLLRWAPPSTSQSANFNTTSPTASFQLSLHYSFVASVSSKVVFISSLTFYAFPLSYLVRHLNRYHFCGMNKIFRILRVPLHTHRHFRTLHLLCVHPGRVLYRHQLCSKSSFVPTRPLCSPFPLLPLWLWW